MLTTGIDIIEIPRVQQAVERWGRRFLQRVYTAGELADCGFATGAGGSYASLAARWAAKEAAAKALGVGLRGLGGAAPALAALHSVGWTEIEVVRGTLGRPTLRLHGSAAGVATALGLAEFALSLSHARAYAVASVVALGAVA